MAVTGATQSLEGIILATRNVADRHRIVSLLTQKHGRIEIWAHQARGSLRRFAGALEPFGTVAIQAARRGDHWLAHSADLQAGRPKLRTQLLSLGRAASLCRLVSLLSPLEQPCPEVAAGLAIALDHLEAGRWARAAGLYVRLGTYAGLWPAVPACCQCGAQRDLRAFVQAQGPVCGKCQPQAELLSDAVLAALAGARIEHEGLAALVEQKVVGWVSWHVGRPLSLLHAGAQSRR